MFFVISMDKHVQIHTMYSCAEFWGRRLPNVDSGGVEEVLWTRGVKTEGGDKLAVVTHLSIDSSQVLYLTKLCRLETQTIVFTPHRLCLLNRTTVICELFS